MTLSLSLPRAERIAVFASALVYTAVTFGAATAPAPVLADNGPYYTAQLAQPAEDKRAVAGGIAWACEGTTCVANKGSSRASRICRSLKREMGEIASFTANGEALPEDQLNRCNGK